MPAVLLPLLLWAGAAAQAVPEQTEVDGYSRYELLAPGTGKFRILYEITAATPGATAFYNPIRPGSIATNERVSDAASGKPLQWEVVDAEAAKAGGVRSPEPGLQFIKVTLARPVPSSGEGRVLIEKTYEDPKSYFVEGSNIIFDRSLGVKRNAVVLPKGYELVSLNYPAQVLQEADGRLLISFWNVTPAQAPLHIVARAAKSLSGPLTAPEREAERAHQSRKIVYYLNQPETHSFALSHDYTETRQGTESYVNIVRAGSNVSAPSATNLDTGETLRWELIKGAAVARAEPEAQDVGPDTTAVLFRFRPVRAGESVRLRIAETYTDEARYKPLPDGSFLWERSLGRAENAVVLPAGWTVAASNVPCTIERLNDGRLKLLYLNPRSDELAVRLVARRDR